MHGDENTTSSGRSICSSQVADTVGVPRVEKRDGFSALTLEIRKNYINKTHYLLNRRKPYEYTFAYNIKKSK